MKSAARYLALVLLGFAVSVGVVFQTQPPADAFVPAVPIVIAGSGLVAPASGLAVGGALVTAGVIGFGVVGVGLLAYGAYATRDSWMPVVRDWLTTTNPPPPGGSGPEGVLAVTVVNAYRIEVAWMEKKQPFARDVVVRINEKTCRNPLTGGSQTTGTTATNPDNNTAPVGIAPATPVQYDQGTMVLTTGMCPEAYPALVAARVYLSLGGSTYYKYITVPIDDAEYTQTTTIQCKNVETGALTEITATQTGEPGRVIIPSCADRVPGTIPWTGVVEGGPASNPVEQITWSHDATNFAAWSDCWDAGGLKCYVEVVIDGTPCLMGQGNCPQWYEMNQRFPARVDCMFGTHILPDSDCTILRYAYQKTHTVTSVLTDTTTNEPQLDPSAPPPAGTTTGGVPETGTNPGTTPTTDPAADPDTAGCYGAAWSWNPVDWVLVPVKCALKWAFVPHTETWGIAGLIDQMEARPPTSVLIDLGAGLSAMAAGFQGAGGCGVLADFSSSDIPDAQITCASVTSVPGYSAGYALVSGALVIMTGIGIFRMFSGLLEDGQ